MSQDSIDAVKQETRFFMEKSFQISLGYVGTLVALAAVVKFALLTDLASLLGVSEAALLSVAILVMNVTYLTLAAACIFATLKRGYYILLHAPEDVEDKFADHRHWEIFVRIADPPPVPRSFFNRLVWRFNTLAWNFDNYYMLPSFLLISIISALAAVYGLNATSGLASRVLISFACFFHVIPAAFLFANALLNAKCRRRAAAVRLEASSGDEQPP